MSEKQQHNANWTRETMTNRYGTVHHHKHDKRHNPYRLHCRSHAEQHNAGLLQNEKVNGEHYTGEKIPEDVAVIDFQRIRNRVVRLKQDMH